MDSSHSIPDLQKSLVLPAPPNKRFSWGLSSFFEDPVLYMPMKDPVIIPCGHTFDRSSLMACFKQKLTCPLCNKPTDPNRITPIYVLKQIIDLYEARKNLDESISQPVAPPSPPLSASEQPPSVSAFSASTALAASHCKSPTRPPGLVFTQPAGSQCCQIEYVGDSANLTYAFDQEAWCSLVAEPAVSSGVHRWEVYVRHTARGTFMLGVATTGFVPAAAHYLGGDALSWGILGVNGTLWAGGQKEKYAQGFRSNHTVVMTLDCATRELSFEIDGTSFGVATSSVVLPARLAISFFHPRDQLTVTPLVAHPSSTSSSSPSSSSPSSTLSSAPTHFSLDPAYVSPSLRVVSIDGGASLVSYQGSDQSWFTFRTLPVVVSGVVEWTVRIEVTHKGTMMLGLLAPNVPTGPGYFLGNDQRSWALLGINGTLWHAGAKSSKAIPGFKTGDQISLRYDADSRTLMYCLNSRYVAIIFTEVPSPVALAVSFYHRLDSVILETVTNARPVDPGPLFDRPVSQLLHLSPSCKTIVHRGPSGWATCKTALHSSASRSFRIDKTEKSHVLIGITSHSLPLPDYLGASPTSWGLLGINGTFWNNGLKERTSMPRFGTSDVVTVSVDASSHSVSFSVNDLPPIVLLQSIQLPSPLVFAVSLFSADDSVTLLD